MKSFSKMAKILKTLRNNWKKSVFAAGILAYGYNFGQMEYQKNLLMRKYCKEAGKFGDVPIQTYNFPRNIVVILNPASNKRKARKEYDKYCAPLLHLSGASVTLLTTDDKNDAISLAGKIPENADALLIAGGDGTVSEVVTGLLRHLHSNTSEKLLPIGILPLGKTNSVAKLLYATQETDNSKLTRFKIMLKATYSVVTEVTNKISAMKIENVEVTDDEKKLLPIYAVHHLKLGSFRDADWKIDKYWYFGKFRSYTSYLFGSYNRDGPIKGQLQYTPPCSGCNKCFNDRMDLERPKEKVENRHWWHFLLYRRELSNDTQCIDYSQIENPSCGISNELNLNTVELTVTAKLIDNQPVLRVNIGPESMSYSDFVKEGWARHNENNFIKDENVHNINAQSIFLNPSEKHPENESWLSIDNEEYEFKPIKIELLHNILSIFISSNDNVV